MGMALEEEKFDESRFDESRELGTSTSKCFGKNPNGSLKYLA